MSTSPEEYGDNNLPNYTTLHITLCVCEYMCACVHLHARAGSHKILLTSYQQNIQEVRNSEKRGRLLFVISGQKPGRSSKPLVLLKSKLRVLVEGGGLLSPGSAGPGVRASGKRGSTRALYEDRPHREAWVSLPSAWPPNWPQRLGCMAELASSCFRGPTAPTSGMTQGLAGRSCLEPFPFCSACGGGAQGLVISSRKTL